MRNILTIIVFITLVSCNEVNIKKEESPTITYSLTGKTITTYTIDGCQYIGRLDGLETDWCTHKGNCNNNHNKDTIK